MNSNLKLAVDRAKEANMPNVNIDRAIKSGTGELKGQADIMEVMYEGFGPGGIAVYVRSLTDNKNRALTNIRVVFNKNDGRFGEGGSVAYLFQKKGHLEVVPPSALSQEERELAIIDAGVEDMTPGEESWELITDQKEVGKVKKHLEEQGWSVKDASLTFIPETTTKITDPELAKQILHFFEVLEDDEDVDAVYSNADISEEMMESLMHD